jgi:TRAP-type mannitol/chloroaromatic compound transport system substrate-binding protein
MNSGTNSSKIVSRRSFLRKGAAVGGIAAAGGLAAPAVLAQSPIVMRLQTSWPASDLWQEFAQNYATSVEEMSAGRLSIDVLPAGAVVGAFQVLDAVNDGLIDIAHSVRCAAPRT